MSKIFKYILKKKLSDLFPATDLLWQCEEDDGIINYREKEITSSSPFAFGGKDVITKQKSISVAEFFLCDAKINSAHTCVRAGDNSIISILFLSSGDAGQSTSSLYFSIYK